MATLYQLQAGLHSTPVPATRRIPPAVNAFKSKVLIQGTPQRWRTQRIQHSRQLDTAAVNSSADDVATEADKEELAKQFIYDVLKGRDEDDITDIRRRLDEGDEREADIPFPVMVESLDSIMRNTLYRNSQTESSTIFTEPTPENAAERRAFSKAIGKAFREAYAEERDEASEDLEDFSDTEPPAQDFDAAFDETLDFSGSESAAEHSDESSEEYESDEEVVEEKEEEEEEGEEAAEEEDDVLEIAPYRFIHIDEKDSARFSYHRRLRIAAACGQPEYAAQIMREMQAEDLPPGPIAWHGLIFAMIRQHDLETAHTAMIEMPTFGLRPETSTISAMSYGFIRNNQPEAALMTYEWMRKIGHPDAYMGWVTVSKQLLTAEHFDVAQLCLAKRDPDWEPNADLFEIILKSMCSPDEDRTMLYVTNLDTIENASLALDIDSDPALLEDLKDPEDEGPDYALTEEDEDESDSEDAIDIPRVNFDAALVVLYELLEKRIGSPEPRFLEPLLNLAANAGFWALLIEVPKANHETTDGRFGEYVLRAIINSEDIDWYSKLMNFGLSMSMRRLRHTVGERLLIMEMGLVNNENWLMMHHFEQAFCTEFYAAPIIDGAMHKVPDVVLMKLLERLSLLKLPAQIQRVLEVMQLDERPMPQRKDLLVSESGVEARTFITMWFDGRSYYYEPTDDFQQPDEVRSEVDGVQLIDNCVVDEDGLAVAPASLKIQQLRAELTARNLSVDGRIADLKRRVTAARGAEAGTLDTAIHQKKKIFQAELKREHQAAKIEWAARKSGSRQPPKPMHTVQEWKIVDGVEEMVAEWEEVDDFRTFFRVSPGVLLKDEFRVAKAPTLDAFGERTLQEDAPDDSDDDEEDEDAEDRDEAAIIGDALLGSKETETERNKEDPSAGPWSLPIGYERYQDKDVDCPGLDGMLLVNEAAGLEQAVTLMQMCHELGGTATKGDINKMLEVGKATQDADSVRELTRTWHQSLEQWDAATATGLYTYAAFVCRQAGGRLQSDQVLQDMQRLLPDSEEVAAV